MKRLPIGVQTFEEIISGEYIYIDKTQHALELIENYKYVFLSRPRRFGKSLFLDTLKEIFQGNKKLFKGLYIYDKYNFEPHPVIKIDWVGDFRTQEKLELTALDIMKDNALRLGIECPDTHAEICFKHLIRNAYEKYNKKVVILIDEYDKPILDNLDNLQEALKRRDFLRAIYSQIKASDAYLRFVFLTGISKFSKASIFSGLNNIEDISLSPKFATICGYTHHDLETSFRQHLKDADLEQVRQWYNGYNFLGEHVYNPFDILLFIRNDLIFDNYWWQSGNPFGIIELIKKGNYYIPELENLFIDKTLLDSFDIENLRIESLLFQAGYLTIDKFFHSPIRGIRYKLRVPNMEVQISLNALFAEFLTGSVDFNIQENLFLALQNEDIDKLGKHLQALFASIPYNNYVKNNLAHYEGYYASVVYAYLASLGLKIIAEDVTDKGRIDLTLLFDNKVFVIEFKVGEEDALQQLKQKKYHEKYMDKSKNVYLIGINFDEKQRNISQLRWEKA